MSKKKILTALAYIAPLAILLYILYANYLPFGYDDFRVIDVGSENDTKGIFRLEESQSLGARQVLNGEYFRPVNGTVYAVYEPRVVLSGATVNISLEGEGVFFQTAPSIEDVQWDYEWSAENHEPFELEKSKPESLYQSFLQKGKKETPANLSETFALIFNWQATEEEILATGDISLIQDPINITLSFGEETITYKLPDYSLGKDHTALIGFTDNTVYFFVNEELIAEKKHEEDIQNISLQNGEILGFEEGVKIKSAIPQKDSCFYFDGNTRLIYPDSEDMFEEGPFSVYLEWIPEKREDRQQLIGHWNWEIFQDSNKITFWIGRVYESGPTFSTSVPIEKEFINRKNSLLVIYKPGGEDENGYISLFVNDIFAGTTNIGKESIWTDYGNSNLSLGWSGPSFNHGKNPYFKGAICNIKFIYQELKPEKKDSLRFTASENKLQIPITGEGKLQTLELRAEK